MFLHILLFSDILVFKNPYVSQIFKTLFKKIIILYFKVICSLKYSPLADFILELLYLNSKCSLKIVDCLIFHQASDICTFDNFMIMQIYTIACMNYTLVVLSL